MDEIKVFEISNLEKHINCPEKDDRYYDDLLWYNCVERRYEWIVWEWGISASGAGRSTLSNACSGFNWGRIKMDFLWRLRDVNFSRNFRFNSFLNGVRKHLRAINYRSKE